MSVLIKGESCKNIMKEHVILKKSIIGAVCTALLILLDQITKASATAHLKGNPPFVIWDGVFELRYLENRGAAFGMLQNRQLFFIVLTVIVLILIGYVYLKRIPNTRHFFFMNVIAVLFFAGAVGNFIDRITQKYVVDFFYFVLIDFPIFNVADIYVTIAAFLLITLGLFYYKEEDYELIFPSRKKSK